MGRKKKLPQQNSSDQQEPQIHSNHPEKRPSERRKSHDNINLDADINDDRSSSEQIEAAIKSMKFREKRGTRMKDLISGKVRIDNFWEENAKYFGGNLDFPEDDDEDDGQYEQSSSGRDEFDSDFDETDSYPGKRGRKKGSRLKKKKGKNLGRKPKIADEQKKEKQADGQKIQEIRVSSEEDGEQNKQKKDKKQKQEKIQQMATRSKQDKQEKPKKQRKARQKKEKQEKGEKKEKLKEKKEKKRKQEEEEKKEKTPKKQKKKKEQQKERGGISLKLEMSVRVEIKDGSRKGSMKSPLSCQGSKQKSREKGEHTKTVKIDIPHFKL